jgi:hypothetical protein
METDTRTPKILKPSTAEIIAIDMGTLIFTEHYQDAILNSPRVKIL